MVKCPNCQAPIAIDPQRPVLKCDYCGCDVKQTVFNAPIVRPSPQPQPMPPVPQPGVEQSRRVLKTVLWATVLSTMIPGIIVAFLALKSSGGVSITQLTGELVTKGRETLGPSTYEKLVAYLGCVNRHSSRINDARERYLGWVDPAKGPTCKERCIGWGVYTIFDLDSCEQALEAFRSAGPPLADLGQGGDAFVAAHRGLAPLLVQVDRYYSQKDYEDDGCAKARAFHRRLMAAFARFAAADAAVRAALEKHYPPALERELAAAEKSEPGGPRYAFLKLALSARKVMAAADASHKQAATTPELRPAIAAYEESLALVEQRCTGISPMDKYHTPCVFSQSSRNAFSKSAKALARRPAKRPRAGWLAEEGTIDHLRNQHRELLSYVPAGLEERLTRYSSCRHP